MRSNKCLSAGSSKARTGDNHSPALLHFANMGPARRQSVYQGVPRNCLSGRGALSAARLRRLCRGRADRRTHCLGLLEHRSRTVFPVRLSARPRLPLRPRSAPPSTRVLCPVRGVWALSQRNEKSKEVGIEPVLLGESLCFLIHRAHENSIARLEVLPLTLHHSICSPVSPDQEPATERSVPETSYPKVGTSSVEPTWQ